MSLKEKNLKRIIRILRVTCFIALPMLVLWFVIFQWAFIPYPKGYKNFVCYSPNHEYYIKRYQTPFESSFTNLRNFDAGTAILYDKSGKELYRGKADLLYGGPHWSIRGTGRSVVFFQGEYDWSVDGLTMQPIAPADIGHSCYDKPVGTVAEQQKSE